MAGNIQPGGSGGASAFQGLNNLGTSLGNTGGKLSSQGQANSSQAGGYFSALAGGSRNAMTQALAPDINNLNSVYGGTARTLSRFLRPGPTKDVQMGEAERERASAVAGLFQKFRPQANQALAGLGGQQVSEGTAAQAGGGSLFGTAANLGQRADEQSAQNNFSAGGAFGGTLFNLLKTFVPGPKGAA